MSDVKASSSAQMNSGGDLDCSVCMELYDEPKVLPCGHMLCHKCVLQLIKGAPATSSSARLVKIKCPTCRSLLSVPKNGALPTVFTMKGFVEKEKQLQAGKRALPESTENEKSVCSSCSEQVPAKQLFVCQSCYPCNHTKNQPTILCSMCIVKKHNGHNILEQCNLASADFLKQSVSTIDTIEADLSIYVTEISNTMAKYEQIHRNVKQQFEKLTQATMSTQSGKKKIKDNSVFYPRVIASQLICDHFIISDLESFLSNKENQEASVKFLEGVKFTTTVHIPETVTIKGFTSKPAKDVIMYYQGKPMSVLSYYKTVYNYTVKQLNWPCVESMPTGWSVRKYHPLETLRVMSGQKISVKNLLQHLEIQKNHQNKKNDDGPPAKVQKL